MGFNLVNPSLDSYNYWCFNNPKPEKSVLISWMICNGKYFICKMCDFGDFFFRNLWNKKKTPVHCKDVFKSWICFIKTRNSVYVIKRNLHAFPIWQNSELEVNNYTFFNQKLVWKWCWNCWRLFARWWIFFILGMHLLEGFIYHIGARCSIMA